MSVPVLVMSPVMRPWPCREPALVHGLLKLTNAEALLLISIDPVLTKFKLTSDDANPLNVVSDRRMFPALSKVLEIMNAVL